MMLWLLAAGLAAVVPWASASSWDPHVVPAEGPYFEGWYTRAVGLKSNGSSSGDSVALIIGAGLLASDAPADALPVYVAILHGRGDTGETRVYERTARSLEQVSVWHAGRRNVSREPRWDTPPSFRWVLTDEGGREVVTYATEGDRVLLRAEAGGATLTARVRVSAWEWDGGRRGPHSVTDVVDAVPLHWYVHSLSSSLEHLRLATPPGLPPAAPASSSYEWGAESGGLVHLEKNWGRAFPSGWIWVQAVVRGEEEGAGVLAVTLGWSRVTGPLHAHLLYVRDEATGLHWDMKPVNSRVLRHDVQPCRGQVHFVLQGWGGEGGEEEREVELRVWQPTGSAGSLMGPTQKGFERLCEESFHAQGVVTLRRGGAVVRQGASLGSQVALEFGGDLLCTEGQQEEEEGQQEVVE